MFDFDIRDVGRFLLWMAVIFAAWVALCVLPMGYLGVQPASLSEFMCVCCLYGIIRLHRLIKERDL